MAGRKKTTPETVEAEVVSEVMVAQPAKMEFRLINPTEDGFLRVIKWNKEERTSLSTAICIASCLRILLTRFSSISMTG